jgi:phospholipid N-methyltransferase
MNTGNTKLAARLREMAATLGKDIEQRNRPRLENTPKRAREAASMREEGRRLEKVQAALIGLADAHEQNQVPQVLININSKKQIEHLLGVYKPTVTEQEQREALVGLANPQAGQVTAADKIKELERQLIGRKIDGFFPTPAEIVRVMLCYADIQSGDRVLEPSAGKGNIADLVRELHPDAQLDVIECNHTLRGILTYKGHNLIGVDCLEHKNPVYQVIVMNPPFEKLADIDHVQHAFNNLLADGGRLVSIIGESAFFRQDKKAVAFRAWLGFWGGNVVDLPAGAFKESGTGVKTRMIIIDKPGSETSPITAEQAIEEAVAQSILPAVQEGDDPLEQFMDEDGDFIPLYPDDLEEVQAEEDELSDAEINAMVAGQVATAQAHFAAALAQTYISAQQTNEDETDNTPSPSSESRERGTQRALPGTGANDKLLKLRQNKLFSFG